MSIITVNVGSYTYDETQIIINPTISKSICSGGFSVGNTACGCLKVGVPNNGHSEGTSVIAMSYCHIEIVCIFVAL